ncbi:MAG: hypothetical protein J5965_07360 [Aeriscardovia sp.]|nr:hypothetical protein [Aeriscardovia sp.]
MVYNKSRAKASAKYQKDNIKQIKIALNVNTDADIINHLEICENKQGYIKDLIRKDIKKQED